MNADHIAILKDMLADYGVGGFSLEREALNAAISCLSVAQGQGWLAIESAPRDGARVLLGRPDDDGDGGVSTCGYWLDELEDGQDYMGHDAGFTDVDYQCFQPGRSFGNEAYRYLGRQPTHWQPFPAAPAQPDGVDRG